MPRVFPVLLAALWLFARPALAHEFWIAPQNYQVETGGALLADLRTGQNFNGAAYPFFAGQTARFDLIHDGRAEVYTGRMGDLPALATAAGSEGLVVIVHQTTPSTVAYATWEKFASFAEHKDFPDIRARHLGRGLPEAGFREVYTRFAKALVGVGAARGMDAPTGLETEFVALANPYTDDLADGFLVQLLYRDAPRGKAQVEVFDRAPGGAVTVTRLRTDAAGKLRIPVSQGHEYLLDAVVLRPPQGDVAAAWETLWAAMTFSVP